MAANSRQLSATVPQGRRKKPTAAIIDSQILKTTDVAGAERRYDAGKKVTGRKRHIAVDTLRLILVLVVHAPHGQDYDGARFLPMRLLGKFNRIKVIFGGSAYGRDGLPEWVKETFGWILQTVLRPEGVNGFVVLPKRWIVERTFV